MKKWMQLSKILVVLLVVAVAGSVFLLMHDNSSVKPIARQGVLDLRGWDFDTNGIVDLDGAWELYYGELLGPDRFKPFGDRTTMGERTGYDIIPGEFSDFAAKLGRKPAGFGYATYHLKVLVDKGKEVYAVKTEFIQTAHKLWADGWVVSESGKVGTSKEDMQGRIVPMTGSFYSETGEINFVLQVSNYYSRVAQIDSIKFGKDAQINALRAKRTGFDLFLFGCAIIGGIYHIIIYLRRRKDKAPLYFSIVCFLIGLRTILVGERLINYALNINYVFSGKLLMWTFFLYIPFLVFFIDKMYEGILSRLVVRLSVYLGIVYFAVVLSFPESMYNHIVLPTEISAMALLLYVLVKLFVRYLIGSEVYLIPAISILVLFVARLNDVLYEYSIIQTGSYAPYGILLFIIMQAYILADKLSKAYSNVEVMSEKLKAVDSLKDEFLANTSQQLRSPLNGIIGLLDSLVSGQQGALSKEQHDTVKVVKASAKRLIDLVNDIHDFSRLNNNDVILECKPVNLKQLVQIIIKSLESMVGIKNIIIINNIKNEFPLAWGDETRIRQILYNLLENAIKFTDFGTIVISAEERETDLEISVADTGIGIPAYKLDTLFERYHSIDTINLRTSGTGLGLFITRKLVDLMDGTIRVESMLAKGSRFIFTLPKYELTNANNAEEGITSKGKTRQVLTEAGNGNKTASTSRNQAGSDDETSTGSDLVTVSVEAPANAFIKKPLSSENKLNGNNEELKDEDINILLVDDENINIRVISYYLRAEGYHVHTATNAKEALEIVNGNLNFDLIILDMMLPDMLGYEVCSILRDTYTLFELPVLMMTADVRVESLVVSLECGANDYMQKPVERAELIARVKTLISLKQAVKRALVLQKEVMNSSVAITALNENVEQNMKRLTELKEYDKLKTEFFANISHELRTPLNVIWGTLQLLESMNTAGKIGDQSIARYLRVMNQNTLRLVRLINNIIDTTRIDGGYLSLQLVNKDIVFIVEEITLSSAEYIESKGKTLIFDTDVEEKIMAIDEEKLERIILNILSNAIKFTSEGDSIFVNLYELGDRIRLSIRDTGIGMPADKLDKIFERFVQVDKSFTRNNEGSGIGLALVKSLVEMHGGIIYASSKLEEGSEFILELPVRLVDETPDGYVASENIDVDCKSKYVERIKIEFSDIYS